MLLKDVEFKNYIIYNTQFVVNNQSSVNSSHVVTSGVESLNCFPLVVTVGTCGDPL